MEKQTKNFNLAKELEVFFRKTFPNKGSFCVNQHQDVLIVEHTQYPAKFPFNGSKFTKKDFSKAQSFAASLAPDIIPELANVACTISTNLLLDEGNRCSGVRKYTIPCDEDPELSFKRITRKFNSVSQPVKGYVWVIVEDSYYDGFNLHECEVTTFKSEKKAKEALARYAKSAADDLAVSYSTETITVKIEQYGAVVTREKLVNNKLTTVETCAYRIFKRKIK